jgi:hypothetical protein
MERGLGGIFTDLGLGELGGERNSSKLERTIVLLTVLVFADVLATDDDLCLCNDKFNDGSDAIDIFKTK